jgi:AraC family transcriptional regulator
VAHDTRAFQGRFGRAVLFDTNMPVVEHAHAQCHVLIKCGGADGHYIVSGERAPFRDDTIVLVNPWMPHHNPRPSGGPVTRVLALYVEPIWLSERRADIMTGQAQLFPRRSVPITARIRSLADHLAALMLTGETAEVRLEEVLHDLIDEVLAVYAEGRSGGALPRSTATLDFRIRRAVAHMRSRATKGADIGRLAEVAGLSRSRFFELFRACTGVPPRLYMDALCIDAAVRKLAETDTRVAAIGEELGFAAPGHFTRFFQQHTSVTPSGYRRAVQALRDTHHAWIHEAEPV